MSEFFVTAVKETMEEREKDKFTRKDFMQLLIQLKNDGRVEDDEGELLSEKAGKSKTKVCFRLRPMPYTYVLCGLQN